MVCVLSLVRQLVRKGKRMDVYCVETWDGCALGQFLSYEEAEVCSQKHPGATINIESNDSDNIYLTSDGEVDIGEY
jgi:hypothetical protein